MLIRRPEIHADQRGWLIELFRKDQLGDQALPVMAYVSMTKPGIARGPHEHKMQTDQIGFVGPSTFIIQMWDNRPSSATFGQKFRLEVGEQNPRLIIIPAGVVHAYKNIGSKDGLVFNAPDHLYRGIGKSGDIDEIRYENSPDSGFVIDF